MDTGKCETQQKEVVDTMETEVRIMGVQRIQETSTASYGKSVEAAAAGGKRRDVSAYPDSDTQTHERGRSVYRSGGTADGREPDADTGSADAGRQ